MTTPLTAKQKAAAAAILAAEQAASAPNTTETEQEAPTNVGAENKIPDPVIETAIVETDPKPTTQPKSRRFKTGVGYKGNIYQAGQSYPLSDEEAHALAKFIES